MSQEQLAPEQKRADQPMETAHSTTGQPGQDAGNATFADLAEAAAKADALATQPQQPLPATGGSGGSKPPATKPVATGDDDLPALSDDEEDDEQPQGEPGDGEGGRMSLMEHLRELRTRLLYSLAAVFVAFLLCWAFVEPVFEVLTRPLLDVLPAGSTAMYTTLPEAFFTRMYIAFIVGLFVASPYIFYQVWAFISPGLYEEEKNFILPVAFISGLFFIAGGLFCYKIVFRFAFSFFVSFSTPEIVNMPKISDYLDFVLKLLLAFGFIFEMPIFAFFLSRMGIVTAQKMRTARRYAILIIFIVAAILTPPDVVSQLLMAIPMLLLYEVSILVAAIFGKKVEEKPAEEEEEYDEEDDDGDDEGAAARETARREPAPAPDPEPIIELTQLAPADSASATPGSTPPAPTSDTPRS